MKATKKTPEIAISLSAELDELASLIEGPRILADELAASGIAVDVNERKTLSAIAAGLSVAVSRLHQVGRVVRGESDPRTILGAHNRDLALEHDVVLEVWAGTAAPRKRK